MEPGRTQSDAVDAMFGAFCDLYNAAPQQRIEANQRRGYSSKESVDQVVRIPPPTSVGGPLRAGSMDADLRNCGARTDSTTTG